MEIRLRSTGQVLTESEFRSSHRDTSFPQTLSAELLDSMNADVVFESPQPTTTRYQTAYRDGAEQINGKWYVKYSVKDMDVEAKTALDSSMAAGARATRNVMLKNSDWTQLADAPVDKTAWQAYRQALREVPVQAGFPWDVTWPTEP